MIPFFTHWDILAVLSWALLVMVLTAGATYAALAFFHRSVPYTWAAAGGLFAGLIVTWLADTSVPHVIGGLIALLGLALAIFGGGPAAVLALSLATHDSVPPGLHGGIMVRDALILDDKTPMTDARHEVLQGGTTIGVLERAAATGAIIAGFPEALAIVVAIKGVGRFTELAAAEARERFIIGTLASLTWACLCGAIVRLAIG
ncbi:hypothetical protein [Luethyella okanaganae]|uniref:Uncharacterized protein n=1 Tax=Luethyella okanaganae TaxID=69372 RepID=A0ABW1VKC6_9MICO